MDAADAKRLCARNGACAGITFPNATGVTTGRVQVHFKDKADVPPHGGVELVVVAEAPATPSPRGHVSVGLRGAFVPHLRPDQPRVWRHVHVAEVRLCYTILCSPADQIVPITQ